MRFSPAALLSRLSRGKAKDPFSGDNDKLGGESGFALSGPQIALGASGLLFALLIGGVAAVVITGEAQDTPPAVMGSFADLEVAEEEQTTATAGPAPETVPANTITASDRSSTRRPWLNPTTPTSQTPQTPAVQIAETPPGIVNEIKSEVMPAENSFAGLATTEEAEDAGDTNTPTQPSLADAGPAPGAPGLFGVTESDSEASLAGGRPRLIEPDLPPIDRQAVAAPPPRYANLSNVQNGAAPPRPNDSAAKIAVVVEGLGLNAIATESAILKLPSAVTLAFSPYARELKKWMDMAKENGHEVLIEVPMESKEFPAQDPGPLGLLTSLEEKELSDRLEKILKGAEGAVGVLDTMGSQYRESDTHISAVFTKLSEENLYYVQGRPGIRVGESTVPTAVADVLIDERPFRAAIDARLDYLERLAKYQGSAVAAVGAKPVSFERLVLWMEQIADKGVSLAPVSQVLIR